MANFFSLFHEIFVTASAFGVVLIGAILVSLISKDSETLLPKLSVFLIERASRRIPEFVRAQHREEWLAGLDEVPEILGKLYFALSICLFACPRTISETKRALRSRYATEVQNIVGGQFDPREQIRSEIAALEMRRKHLSAWFASANTHAFRRQGLSRSRESERISERLRYLKTLL